MAIEITEKQVYDKVYHQKHRDKKIRVAIKWNRDNKEKRKKIKDKWRQENKEKTNFLTRKYIYRRKHAVGDFSLQESRDLLKWFRGLCAYCKIKKATTIDHVIPLSRNGTNFLSNLVPACVSCNSKKRDKLLSEINKNLWIS